MEAVIELHRSMSRAMTEKDTRKLDSLLDKNYTLTHMTGYVQPRQEWLSAIDSEEMKYYEFKEVSEVVESITDNKAVIVGKNKVRARIWGMNGTWNLQLTSNCELRNGKWIALKTVATTF
jgi:vacuolar-type H+-ATPase subunit E/Vma4